MKKSIFVEIFLHTRQKRVLKTSKIVVFCENHVKNDQVFKNVNLYENIIQVDFTRDMIIEVGLFETHESSILGVVIFLKTIK